MESKNKTKDINPIEKVGLTSVCNVILFRILKLITLIQSGGGIWPCEAQQPTKCKVLIPAKWEVILEDKVFLPEQLSKMDGCFFVFESG
ncbi:hypothetical protein KH172YL63_19470 [Bacillus sp. KH172YL63]|nr:hypothetical protein KH172YL63_19470 [Bacillus sp. KH172YL63]